jgi:hypothetical protein
MPRRKVREYNPSEGDTISLKGTTAALKYAELVLVASPTCPACKALFKSKSVRYYASKSVITVVPPDRMKLEDMGEWVLDSKGLVLMASTPTFLVRCKDGRVLWRYRVQAADIYNADAVMQLVLGTFKTLATECMPEDAAGVEGL